MSKSGFDLNEIESNVTRLLPGFQMSDELRERVAGLTGQQQNTLHRVAMAYLSKRKGAVSALFAGEDAVCSHVQFYRKKKVRQPAGWYHQVNYRAALNAYMDEYRPHYEKAVVSEAEAMLKALAIKSVEKLDSLLESYIPAVQLGAVKLAMEKIGLGKSEDAERVTVVIADAQWQPK